jgi:hypothetical protein
MVEGIEVKMVKAKDLRVFGFFFEALVSTYTYDRKA